MGLASGSLSQATEIFGSWPRSLSIPESHERNMFFMFFKRTDGDFPDQMGDPWWMVPEHVAQLSFTRITRPGYVKIAIENYHL